MVEAVENFVRAGYPLDADAVLLVEVTGVTELVANAMHYKGENDRKLNLRMQPVPGAETEEGADDE